MSEDPVSTRYNPVGYHGSTTNVSTTRVTVTPQPITDKSFIDSVTGFINEVVPGSYTPGGPETREQVQWARFEQSDLNDAAFFGASEDSFVPSPLLLVLGYTHGVQVWTISTTGEATEVLSWRQGSVRVLRFLPTPFCNGINYIHDPYAEKRPLIALVDVVSTGPQFCLLTFISLKTAEQVKHIQFKNPIVDVLANRNSIVVTFNERIAVFDACTFDECFTVTTCYLSPGLCSNPVALGERWLAYAERTMVSAWRSNGGCDGEGVPSYTASVLFAAKSLGKGLRGLGGTVANSLAGSVASPHHYNPTASNVSMNCENAQPGIVTIIDVLGNRDKKTLKRTDEKGKLSFNSRSPSNTIANSEHIVAHFQAHSESIVALNFDPSGVLLLTVDKRGHDFHLFKIQAHPFASSQAAVHHLYTLHRGDTTAKVQDIAFSWDSRWVAVSTLRGTTHVFPITPYGGPVGLRTHGSPHVVNRVSRFQRSAGIDDEAITATTSGGKSSSPPVGNVDNTGSSSPTMISTIPAPYLNPRVPPFPHSTVIYPLAQIRQPVQFGPGNVSLQANIKSSTNRQRLISSSEDMPNLKLCSIFAPPRGFADVWRRNPNNERSVRTSLPVDSLFIMACHGGLVQYDLDPRHVSNVPKEKVCEDTAIEVNVTAKATWTLLRALNWMDVPVSRLSVIDDHPLLISNIQKMVLEKKPATNNSQPSSLSLTNEPIADDRWLSQVEIVTHAGPHRRLWMGPQFVFKTYNVSSNTGSTTNLTNASVDIDNASEVNILATNFVRPAQNAGRRSNPVDIAAPINDICSSSVPIFIESTSFSSLEQSPRLFDIHKLCRRDSDSLSSLAGDIQLRQDLADAMIDESCPDAVSDQGQSNQPQRGDSNQCTEETRPQSTTGIPVPCKITKVVNPAGTVITLDDQAPGPEKSDSFENLAVETLTYQRIQPCEVSPISFDVVGAFDGFDDQEVTDVHENTDERLFRPIITAPIQVLAIQEPPDHMVKSLDYSNNGYLVAELASEDRMSLRIDKKNRPFEDLVKPDKVKVKREKKSKKAVKVEDEALKINEPIAFDSFEKKSKKVVKVEDEASKINEPITFDPFEKKSKTAVKVDDEVSKINEPITFDPFEKKSRKIVKVEDEAPKINEPIAFDPFGSEKSTVDLENLEKSTSQLESESPKVFDFDTVEACAKGLDTKKTKPLSKHERKQLKKKRDLAKRVPEIESGLDESLDLKQQQQSGSSDKDSDEPMFCEAEDCGLAIGRFCTTNDDYPITDEFVSLDSQLDDNVTYALRLRKKSTPQRDDDDNVDESIDELHTYLSKKFEGLSSNSDEDYAAGKFGGDSTTELDVGVYPDESEGGDKIMTTSVEVAKKRKNRRKLDNAVAVDEECSSSFSSASRASPSPSYNSECGFFPDANASGTD